MTTVTQTGLYYDRLDIVLEMTVIHFSAKAVNVRFSCILATLYVAHCTGAVDDVVISAQGRALLSAAPSLRLRVNQAAGRHSQLPTMMRRDTDLSANVQSLSVSRHTAPVEYHTHSLLSYGVAGRAVEMESVSAEGPPVMPPDDVTRLHDPDPSGAEVPFTDATPHVGHHASATHHGYTSIISPDDPRQVTFKLNTTTPVLHMHHQIANIRLGQWPSNFCLGMNFIAPEGNTPEHDRCIVLFGGNETCGSFYVYLNEFNEPGMGVRCEDGTTGNGEGPLLAEHALTSNTEHNLYFCYDNATKNASIWRDHKMEVSSTKTWHFHREGWVSVFVGSHVPDSVSEGLYEEDKAKLLELFLQDVSITTSTTTTTTLAPLELEMIPPTTTYEEVDMEDTPDSETTPLISQKIIWMTTTPKPHWDRTHHLEILNTSDTVDVKNVTVRTEITTVTDYDVFTNDTAQHNISIPGGNKTGQHTIIKQYIVNAPVTPAGEEPALPAVPFIVPPTVNQTVPNKTPL